MYEGIVAEFPEEAEAYWGLCLCKFGIEYVDDPATAKKIPTCHRTSFESIFDDSNFDLDCEYADGVARNIYREEAKEIDRLQKEILKIAQNEEPFDVFICYKESDENGGRTVDSELAHDIYDVLTEKGYKVFFSRITLKAKLGQDYEPYIFSALNSAKVMLAIGTKYEYYNAVWVKNEWSRFLALMANDSTKMLIPCYRDIDAYDMPKEFSHLQGQDLSSPRAFQDLITNIEKIIPRASVQPAAISVGASASAGADEPIIKRAFLYLEDKDWEGADKCVEKILDINPENANAYIIKLCIELKLPKPEDIAKLEYSISDNNNFKKALRFADAAQKNELESYTNAIAEKIELNRKTDIYNDAVEKFNAARSPVDYASVKKILESISGFKNVDDLIKECEDQNNLQSASIYSDSLNRFNNARSVDDYMAAKEGFRSVGEYKDSKQLMEICTKKIYETCIGLVNRPNPETYTSEIARLLRSNSEFGNSAQIADLIDDGALYTYKNAKTAVINNDFSRAERLLRSIDGFFDAGELADFCQNVIDQKCNKNSEEYKRLQEFASVSTANDRILHLMKHEDFGEAEKEENVYKKASEFLDEGDYIAAHNLFKKISAYKNSDKKIQICQKAEELEKKIIESKTSHQQRLEQYCLKIEKIEKTQRASRFIIADCLMWAVLCLLETLLYQFSYNSMLHQLGFIGFLGVVIVSLILLVVMIVKKCAALDVVCMLLGMISGGFGIFDIINFNPCYSGFDYYKYYIGSPVEPSVKSFFALFVPLIVLGATVFIVVKRNKNYNNMILEIDNQQKQFEATMKPINSECEALPLAVKKKIDENVDKNVKRSHLVEHYITKAHEVRLFNQPTLAFCIVLAAAFISLLIHFIRCSIEYNDYKEWVDHISNSYNESDAYLSDVEKKYNKAVELMNSGKYRRAIEEFDKNGNIKDSKELKKKCMILLNQHSISKGNDFTAVLKADGTVSAVGNNFSKQCNVEDWKDIIAISGNQSHTVGLRSNGTVVATGASFAAQCDVFSWKDIIAISTGFYHTVGVKSDGTVITTGVDFKGQCNVDSWRDIVAVSANEQITVGLRSDGTVVATGENDYNQCQVDFWTDIVAISASNGHTVGLKADGTVVAIGSNTSGECDVNSWRDIAAISAFTGGTVGLKEDGTLIFTGDYRGSNTDFDDWNDIVAISAGTMATIGLRSDGSVIAVGSNEHGKCNVGSFKNVLTPDKMRIANETGYLSAADEAYNTAAELMANGKYRQAADVIFKNDLTERSDAKALVKNCILKLNQHFICAAGNNTYAVMGDGTVKAAGDRGYGQCDVDFWRDITSIDAGDYNMVGVKSDGTVNISGMDYYGTYDVKYWNNIVQVSLGETQGLGERYTNIVGLKSDGTVVSAGSTGLDLFDTSSWTDIAAVVTGGGETLGIKMDGTVVSASDGYYGTNDFSSWKNIVAISIGSGHIVGLRSDGTVVAKETGYDCSEECNVSSWRDIVNIAAGRGVTVGIKADGTTLMAGNIRKGGNQVTSWRNLQDISADLHIVGLNINGSLSAAGDNFNGQCDVGDWRGLKTP